MSPARTVCVVAEGTAPIGAFSDAVDATVTVTTADDAAVTLCRSSVDCLVVPADEPSLAANLAYAARGLYPDLPVVVYGPEPPATDRASTVAASALDDPAVVDAVDAALSGARPKAGREPSRPETILASVFEGLPVHLYAKDADARHLLASTALMDPTDLLGLTDLETLSGDPDYDRPNYNDDRQVIDEAEPVVRMHEYSDSLDMHLRTSKVPWRDAAGEVVGLVGLTEDVTELQRQKERLRRRNRRLRKVALLTAHELRNELQIATGHLSQVDADGEAVAAIASSLDRLSTVVDRIVSLSSERADPDDSAEMWLSALAREVWEGFDAAGATLSVPDDRRVRGEEESTRLLVEILIENALAYGGPDVTVEVSGTDGGFYVADDGPGIPLSPPERALEAGVSATPSVGDAGGRAVDADTSGFGLYIARRIADDNGWGLQVRESDAGGTRFDVTGIDGPG